MGIEVAVGTYNHVLIGIGLSHAKDREKEWQFVPTFTDQGHDGCIKTVATGGKFLASGSTDETIRLYDLKKHVELGSLVQQGGSITEIAFSGQTHMLSASADGTIAIWECKSWECVKTLKGHRDAVNSISIHPTGRLALSVSKDKTVRTWNLLTGRSAYTTNIKQVGELVIWSPSGDSYVVSSGCKATVYKISDASETCVIDCQKPILTMNFLSENILLLGGELDEVIVYDIKKEKQLQAFKAHDIRVKSLKSIKNPVDEKRTLLLTVASDGGLRVWDFDNDSLEEKPKMLTEIHVPGRPICMTVSSN
eukprot:Seg494.3_Seg494.5 transcript_id=Seg494.3_Seg494.5/GoldUCD/mRNA.D3Y31 product="p21-activated protein kinase-interacting protein 1-like" protein_id=Seg494.3_Seg494.5/GoldUCD/D3Y31